MDTSRLSVSNLTVQYHTDRGSAVALGGINLTLEAGQNLGLVGESGCGKSMTALALMGLLPEGVGSVAAGSITFDGEDLTTASETRLREIRGNDFELHIQGVDELMMRHESILFEACNTSFQVHLQIHPDEFVDQFNWAQAMAGPVLASAVNSPLLMGKELWCETRIALFQQSIDTRSSSHAMRERQPRVAFGTGWVKNSVVDIYKEDIARYTLLLILN